MSPRHRLAKFTIVAVIGMAVQLVVVALLTTALPVNATVASLAGVLAALAHNFAWHVRWTWRDRRPGASLPAAFVRFLTGNGLVSLSGTAALIPVLTVAYVPPIAANLVAIAICGIANFVLADRYAFRSPPRASACAPAR